MHSVRNYSEETDYHAIMMYDPWKEEAQNLGHELLMTKIDLTFTEQRCEFWKRMYENEVESNNRQC